MGLSRLSRVAPIRLQEGSGVKTFLEQWVERATASSVCNNKNQETPGSDAAAPEGTEPFEVSTKSMMYRQNARRVAGKAAEDATPMACLGESLGSGASVGITD